MSGKGDWQRRKSVTEQEWADNFARALPKPAPTGVVCRMFSCKCGREHRTFKSQRPCYYCTGPVDNLIAVGDSTGTP